MCHLCPSLATRPSFETTCGTGGRLPYLEAGEDSVFCYPQENLAGNRWDKTLAYSLRLHREPCASVGVRRPSVPGHRSSTCRVDTVEHVMVGFSRRLPDLPQDSIVAHRAVKRQLSIHARRRLFRLVLHSCPRSLHRRQTARGCWCMAVG